MQNLFDSAEYKNSCICIIHVFRLFKNRTLYRFRFIYDVLHRTLNNTEIVNFYVGKFLVTFGLIPVIEKYIILNPLYKLKLRLNIQQRCHCNGTV